VSCDYQRWACISAAANITNTSSFPLLSPASVLSQAMIDRSFAAQSDATALRSSHFWLLSLCCTRKSTAGFCCHIRPVVSPLSVQLAPSPVVAAKRGPDPNLVASSFLLSFFSHRTKCPQTYLTDMMMFFKDGCCPWRGRPAGDSVCAP